MTIVLDLFERGSQRNKSQSWIRPRVVCLEGLIGERRGKLWKGRQPTKGMPVSELS